MISPLSRAEDIHRIRRCFDAVADLVRSSDRRETLVDYSQNGDPCTTLDREINRIILENLRREGEGWLSEENEDNPERLRFSRVWVVDPIDGTREFVEGIPEWCVSLALVEEHEVVVGGILNPSTGEMFLGSMEAGLEIAGPVRPRHSSESGASSCILVSRREHREGKWRLFEEAKLDIIPVGSIAYRLAQVAAGYADATGTFQPRCEWDVAGGVALVLAAGGKVQMLDGTVVRFNQAVPRLQTFFAFRRDCPSAIAQMYGVQLR